MSPLVGVPHVVYIVGWGRSGSTFLTAILGELDGAFAAGEVRLLWSHGVIGQRLCGCGRPIPECPIWSQVLARLEDAPCTAEEMADIQARRLRSRNFAAELTKLAWRRRPDAELARYTATYQQALEAIIDVTGAEIVIDSSKTPVDALLLERAGVELRAVNVVRDPRTVAASWSRRKRLDDGDDGAELKVFSPWKSSLLWSLWNALALLVGRRGHRPRLTVLYETFLEDPATEIERVAAACGLTCAGLDLDDRDVQLGPNHLVAGNGDRFRTGEVRIKEQDPARFERRRDALLASIASFPMTLRYGYRVFRRRDRA